MHNKIIKNFAFITLMTITLSACNGFFEKDNIPPPHPLVNYKQEINPKLMWSVNTGSNGSDDYLKMSPTIYHNNIFTASTKGRVNSINKYNSKLNWKVDLSAPLSTGPGVGDGIVVVASRKGDVIALQEDSGRPLWQRNFPSEILANPAVSKGTVIIKSNDGYVRALSIADGTEKWAYQQPEPNLLLRGASKPIIKGNSVIAGFANGSLSKFNMNSGLLDWNQNVAVPTGAFSIERMIDIDADPIIFERHIYAATYQGKIALLDWYSGSIKWSQDISSYTGMATDGDSLYISDAQSLLWSFNAQNGAINWRINELQNRWITGPALLNDYVIVGDEEGYVHWVNKNDGRLAARVNIGKPILAAPLVNDGVLYVLAKNGNLSAYTLG